MNKWTLSGSITITIKSYLDMTKNYDLARESYAASLVYARYEDQVAQLRNEC